MTTVFKEFTVKNFTQLHEVLGKYKETKNWIFRGQADNDWALIPKVGRLPYKGVDERQVLESWKRRAIEYTNFHIKSDWDWLAIAQHHGLVTRLLDWTTNPLSAAFFAVREIRTGPAIVYAGQFYRQEFPENDDPFLSPGVAIFRPKGVVPRIARQGGLFTIHGKPSIPLDKGDSELKELDRITIQETYREQLLSDLSFYGINSATLFPDLDGLSAFMNWTIETREYWSFAFQK